MEPKIKRENQRGVIRAVSRAGRMNPIFTSFSGVRQDGVLGRMDLTPPQTADSKAGMLEELVHELRQPLGAIETLSYFLEITTDDEQVCGHLQRIQSLVGQANRVLERYCRSANERV
jgi:signal transduction histidine kinase